MGIKRCVFSFQNSKFEASQTTFRTSDHESEPSWSLVRSKRRLALLQTLNFDNQSSNVWFWIWTCFLTRGLCWDATDGKRKPFTRNCAVYRTLRILQIDVAYFTRYCVAQFTEYCFALRWATQFKTSQSGRKKLCLSLLKKS